MSLGPRTCGHVSTSTILLATSTDTSGKGETMRKPLVSDTYIALLDIKAVIRQWQDLDKADSSAVTEIERILRQLKERQS